MRDYILLSQNDYNDFIVRNFEQIKNVATPLNIFQSLVGFI